MAPNGVIPGGGGGGRGGGGDGRGRGRGGAGAGAGGEEAEDTEGELLERGYSQQTVNAVMAFDPDGPVPINLVASLVHMLSHSPHPMCMYERRQRRHRCAPSHVGSH